MYDMVLEQPAWHQVPPLEMKYPQALYPVPQPDAQLDQDIAVLKLDSQIQFVPVDLAPIHALAVKIQYANLK